VSVTFSLYDQLQFGTLLWTEVQNLELDQNGRYSTLLGSGSPAGIPLELFTSGHERWLEVQAAGQPEEPRTLMVSVPYAFKAQDAATLGGKPASAYMLAQPEDRSTARSGVTTSSNQTASSNQITAAAPTPGPSGGVTATQFTSTNSTGPSFISQATSGPPLRITSTAVNANLNADLIDGFDSSAFPKLTLPNIFTATQTIDNGNVDLDSSTATTGNITKNGTRFLHNFGVNNTFLGVQAGNVSMSGGNNTAVGFQAFSSNTVGQSNVGLGILALQTNTTGNFNIAVGDSALHNNTSGSENVAIGLQSLRLNIGGADNTATGINTLFNNTGGFRNTAMGANALNQNISGSDNVAVGANAGSNATESNNIYVGAGVQGVAGESNAIYLGKVGTQIKTVIAGVRGTTLTDGEPVLIDANGRLGSGPVATGTNSVGTAQVIDDSLTASDLGPGSVTASELAADAVTADKVAFNYAASTTEGGPASDLACVACVTASEVGFSFASLGANTFAGTQTVDTGNLDLDTSTAVTGNLTKNGTLFLHNFGASNTFLGLNAGNLAMTGNANTATGSAALRSNTAGSENTAIGASALTFNTIGHSNTGIGSNALSANTEGTYNTAVGLAALYSNTTGTNNNALYSNTTGGGNTAASDYALYSNTAGTANTAIGQSALRFNTTGNQNVAVGVAAGINATTGSNNIYLGNAVAGIADESNAMYLGRVGTQTKTVIAGVRGTGVTGGEMVVVDADGRLGSAPIGAGTDTVGSAQVVDDSLTASDLAANSVTTSELAPDSVTAGKVAFNYAGSASEGGPALDLTCLGCVAANEVGFTFAGLAANTFQATQRIDTGNLDLNASTSTGGNITKNGTPFLHNFGTENLFLGEPAGNLSMTGYGNTAIGWRTLLNNTQGLRNTAIGSAALATNTTGNQNTGVGSYALASNTSGSLNVAVGQQALVGNTSGSNNVALGMNALRTHTASDNNIAIGRDAAANLSSGAGNIMIGTFAGQNLNSGNLNLYIANQGIGNESSTIRIGEVQTRAFINGIRGATTGLSDAIPVVIDSAGQLGTTSSSRRFKEDIRDMADVSSRLFRLRPVTFSYKRAYVDGSKPIQYGLIAEEVAEVFPELAVRNADGGVDTVHYEMLSVLLLNETQKQQKQLERQEQRIELLERQLNGVLAASEEKR
jgi:hypothetical protein